MPDCVLGLNHKGLETVLKYSKKIVLSSQSFYSQLINYLRAVECPYLDRVLKEFDTVEKRAKISLNDYLGKQPLTSPLQTYTHSIYRYYGELNVDGKEHGRGIDIYNDGFIRIGY